MSKKPNAVFAEVRRRELVDFINRAKKVTVSELCSHFDVSAATIRVDLTELEKANLLKRVHGGALSISDVAEPELTSKEKSGLHSAQKRAIAQLARGLIVPGSTIALDTGTTTLELAKQLADLPELTILTNDIKIALYLEEYSSHTVIFLGGTIRKHFHCTVGQMVTDSLEAIHIDTFFVATNAINLEWGLSTPSIDIANVKSKLIRNARRTVLLADSSKIGKDSLARFATIREIDTFITDSNADPSFLESIRQTGVDVICT